ncbi:hypothetical protein AM10699_06440 [Acaryochloris marina MBIC10699]|nr:hypothetical protein AM10699_06440 [Acaryochloris marina MBIC10699]
MKSLVEYRVACRYKDGWCRLAVSSAKFDYDGLLCVSFTRSDTTVRALDLSAVESGVEGT